MGSVPGPNQPHGMDSRRCFGASASFFCAAMRLVGLKGDRGQCVRDRRRYGSSADAASRVRSAERSRSPPRTADIPRSNAAGPGQQRQRGPRTGAGRRAPRPRQPGGQRERAAEGSFRQAPSSAPSRRARRAVNARLVEIEVEQRLDPVSTRAEKSAGGQPAPGFRDLLPSPCGHRHRRERSRKGRTEDPKFPVRQGPRGIRCGATGRISRSGGTLRGRLLLPEQKNL
jgi:hypothetical protein